MKEIYNLIHLKVRIKLHKISMYQSFHVLITIWSTWSCTRVIVYQLLRIDSKLGLISNQGNCPKTIAWSGSKLKLRTYRSSMYKSRYRLGDLFQIDITFDSFFDSNLFRLIFKDRNKTQYSSTCKHQGPKLCGSNFSVRRFLCALQLVSPLYFRFQDAQ